MSDDLQDDWSGDRDALSNPYSAAPIEDLDGTASLSADGDIEAIRKFHLKHEASIKSIGTLYMLGAIFLVPMGLFILIAPTFDQSIRSALFVALLGLAYFAIGLLQVFTAFGLRKLAPWSRIPAIILSVIGLIGFPIGTIVSAYFLYLLISEKGKVVLSDRYQAIVAQTPHIQYKTSIIVWCFLGILILLLAFAMVAAFVA